MYSIIFATIHNSIVIYFQSTQKKKKKHQSDKM